MTESVSKIGKDTTCSWRRKRSPYDVRPSASHKKTQNPSSSPEINVSQKYGSAVKNLSATQETRVQFLGREDLLEKEMATHSSILAWEIPWTEEPGGLQTKGLQRVRHDSVTKQQQQIIMIKYTLWKDDSCYSVKHELEIEK